MSEAQPHPSASSHQPNAVSGGATPSFGGYSHQGVPPANPYMMRPPPGQWGYGPVQNGESDRWHAESTHAFSMVDASLQVRITPTCTCGLRCQGRPSRYAPGAGRSREHSKGAKTACSLSQGYAAQAARAPSPPVNGAQPANSGPASSAGGGSGPSTAAQTPVNGPQPSPAAHGSDANPTGAVQGLACLPAGGWKTARTLPASRPSVALQQTMCRRAPSCRQASSQQPFSRPNFRRPLPPRPHLLLLPASIRATPSSRMDGWATQTSPSGTRTQHITSSGSTQRRWRQRQRRRPAPTSLPPPGLRRSLQNSSRLALAGHPAPIPFPSPPDPTLACDPGTQHPASRLDHPWAASPMDIPTLTAARPYPHPRAPMAAPIRGSYQPTARSILPSPRRGLPCR